MNDDLISRSALLEKAEGGTVCWFDIKHASAVDAVNREVFEQIMWERDTAMEQLKEHGIPFGGIAPDVVEVVRCKDCKHSRERNEHERHYLVDGVLVCTFPECSGDCWFATWEDHWCSYGERRADNAN